MSTRPSKQLRQRTTTVLRQHDIIPTRQRVDIAAVLLARHQHLSADQVLKQVNIDGAGISKATVYNTLGLLAEKGLLRELSIDPDKTVYDSNLAPHSHLFNVDTGALTDFTAPLPSFDVEPHVADGTTVVGVDVVIRVRNSDRSEQGA